MSANTAQVFCSRISLYFLMQSHNSFAIRLQNFKWVFNVEVDCFWKQILSRIVLKNEIKIMKLCGSCRVGAIIYLRGGGDFQKKSKFFVDFLMSSKLISRPLPAHYDFPILTKFSAPFLRRNKKRRDPLVGEGVETSCMGSFILNQNINLYKQHDSFTSCFLNQNINLYKQHDSFTSCFTSYRTKPLL